MEGFHQQAQTTPHAQPLPTDTGNPSQQLGPSIAQGCRAPPPQQLGLQIDSSGSDFAHISGLVSGIESASTSVSTPQIHRPGRSRVNITSNACQPCRKRKSKCDATKPFCKSCTDLHSTNCWYDVDDDQRRKGALRRRIMDLQHNLAQYKEALEVMCYVPDGYPGKDTLARMVNSQVELELIHQTAMNLRAAWFNPSIMANQFAPGPAAAFNFGLPRGALHDGAGTASYGRGILPVNIPAPSYGMVIQPSHRAPNGYGPEIQPDNGAAMGYGMNLPLGPVDPTGYGAQFPPSLGGPNGYGTVFQPGCDVSNGFRYECQPSLKAAPAQVPGTEVPQLQDQTNSDDAFLGGLYFDIDADEGSTSKIDNSQ